MMRSFTQFFKNKIVLTAIGIILVCLLVWVYFFIREGEKKNSMDAMRAIPADVVYALRINDLKQFNARLNSEGEMTSLLRQEKSMTDVVQTLSFIVDTLAAENVAAGDLIMQPMWVSAHIFGRDIAFLFSLNLPDNLYLANVKQITPAFSNRGYTITEKSYDDERITTFKREDVEVFHAAVVRRVLVVSSSRVLVEMAIRQARVKSSLADNPTFLAASKTAGAHVDVNLYVNHKQLPKLLNLYLAKPYTKSMNFITRSGDFLVLDALLKNEAMQLSGFLFAEDMQESYFSIFKNQKSQKIASLEILPRVTDGLLSISISDVKLLIKDYASYYNKEIGTGRNLHREQQERIMKRTGVNPEQWYTSLHSTELSLAHVPITGVEEKDMWFTVIKSGKIDAARKAVKELISTAARIENKKEEDYVKTDLMSNNEPLTVYQNPTSGLTAAVFGGVFEQCPENYFTMIGDYIVFSSSRNALKEFALAALLKRTLAQTINISNYIASESNLLVYLNPSKADVTYLNIFKPNIQNNLRKSKLLAASGGMGFQMRVMNDKAYCNAFFKMQGKVEERSNSGELQHDFEVKLGAPLATTPWVVKNHRNGQKELLVQDNNNNIYLIDNQGILLWRRALSEPIMGDVQQVDYLKNKKLQLAFNTKSKIYLIDRLGRDVEKFPITLPQKASAPMSIFDYDKSRDYRFFVPGEDNKIYAFDNKGKALDGFKPSLTFGTISQPVMHIRAQGKDFLVVADNRRINILNRKGEERVKVKEPVTLAFNSKIECEYGPKGEVARMVTTNIDGDIVHVYLDGKVEYMKLNPRPGEHHFFAYGNNTYVILDGKDLRVYDPDTKLRFSYSMKRIAKDSPDIFVLDGEKTFYSIFSAEEGKDYLIDDAGTIIKKFPIKSTTPILVDNLKDNDNTYNVVVGDENGFLNCYNVAK